MKCLVCGGKLQVTDSYSRKKTNEVRRYRECLNCFTRYTSIEMIEIETLEPYIKEKLEKKGFYEWSKKRLRIS